MSNILSDPLGGGQSFTSSDSEEDSRYGNYFRYEEDESDYPAGAPANWMFATTFAILFCQYLLLTFITPFFPRELASYDQPPGVLTPTVTPIVLGGFWTGVIFAAGPLGLTAMIPVVPILLRVAGTKTVIQVGLLLSTIFLVLFGFTPTICNGHEELAKYVFVASRFVYGAGSALAEAGAVATITRRSQLHPNDQATSKVLTAMELMAGFGSLVGPAVGGLIYSFYPEAERLQTVHVYIAIFPLVLVGMVFCAFKNRKIAQNTRKLNTCRVINLQRCLSGFALFVNLTSFYALETTLQWWLADPMGPFQYSECWMIGLTLVVASLTYTVVAIPLGSVLDRCCMKRSRRLKAFCAGGLFCVSIALLLVSSCSSGSLFPAGNASNDNTTAEPLMTCFAWLPLPSPNSSSAVNLTAGSRLVAKVTAVGHLLHELDPAPLEMVSLYVGLVVLGIGQSAALLPVLPDMQSGVPENDDLKRQAISTLWISWYAAATALGPIVGTNLREVFGFGGMCFILSVSTAFTALLLIFAMFPNVLNPPANEVRAARSPASSVGSGSFRFDAQTAMLLRESGALFGDLRHSVGGRENPRHSAMSATSLESSSSFFSLRSGGRPQYRQGSQHRRRGSSRRSRESRGRPHAEQRFHHNPLYDNDSESAILSAPPGYACFHFLGTEGRFHGASAYCWSCMWLHLKQGLACWRG
eukprot:INCI5954.2.p1 GENE.INCI5954.2~~INCI5954.2.p1  ORF type:complete len:723 (+),score=92.85 INCI5954.2:81-2171(+)